MNTFRTFFVTFVFALFVPLLFVGCDSNSPHVEEETETSTLEFTIKNAADQTSKATITRDNTRDLKAGDEVNIFVEGPENRKKTEFVVPDQGDTNTAEFIVPEGDYDVRLIGYEPVGDGAINVNAKNGENPPQVDGSVILGAATQNSHEVNAGTVTTIDFTSGGGAEGNSQFQRFHFDFSFNASLTTDGENTVVADFSTTSESPNGVEGQASFIDFRTEEPVGHLGVAPGEEIVDYYPESAPVAATFWGSGGEADANFPLPLEVFEDNSDGKVSVLTRFEIAGEYEASDQELFLYNNVDGSAQEDVPLEGDGGLVVVFGNN